MTSPVPPSSSSPVLPALTASAGATVGGPGAGAAITPVQPVTATAATAPVQTTLSAAQVAPILAAAQAALAQTVNLSADAQQAIKAEAFAKLVSQLVQQIQGGTVQLPERWPAGGVAPQWQALLSALVQQGTAAQPLPQLLVSMQSWPSALTQAVLQEALGQAARPPQGGGSPAAALPGAAAGAQGVGAPLRPAIPALQNWLVQQGVLHGPDGDRAFTLTLKVPVAWAQAQAVLGQALASRGALPAAALPLPGAAAGGPATLGVASALAGGAGLQLPFAGSVQQLANATFGLVLQPQGVSAAQAQAMRTSAVLQMDFQPLPAAATAAQQATSAALLPAGMLPQEAYQALLARGGDPWLHMGQLQASGQLPRERQHHGKGPECDVAGCQYQGRAECAQPFCAEMNSLWAASRASRR